MARRWSSINGIFTACFKGKQNLSKVRPNDRISSILGTEDHEKQNRAAQAKGFKIDPCLAGLSPPDKFVKQSERKKEDCKRLLIITRSLPLNDANDLI